MVSVFEQVKRLVGWCPYINSSTYRSNKPVDFLSQSITSSGEIIKGHQVRSDHIAFPANTALVTLYLIPVIFFLINISPYLDHSILIIAVVILYSIFYLLAVKTYQACILVDNNGIHLESFRLRSITLDYKNVNSVKSFKWNTSKKTSIAFKGIFFAVVFIVITEALLNEHWKLIIATLPLILVVFLLFMKEKTRGYQDFNTQLYIGSRTKKWYELSPYYSVITDRITAAKIQASIKYYMEAKQDGLSNEK